MIDLINKEVSNKIYGHGIITGQEVYKDIDYVRVKFDSYDIQEKKYQYDLCFDASLTILDIDTALLVKQDIVQKKNKLNNNTTSKKQTSDNNKNGITYIKATSDAKRNTVIHPFNSVDEFCEKYKCALTDEINHLKSTGGKKRKIFNGKLVDSKLGRYIYSFDTDSEYAYPDGTQISLWFNLTEIAATIIGCEDFTLIIMSLTYIGDDIFSLEFSAEPWYLLNSLIDRLDDIQSNNPSPIIKSLVCDGYKKTMQNKPINIGQHNAILSSVNNPISFIWGPPGTGKTETLAEIALKHIKLNHRILMLSYSNVSVDGAILRVYKLDNNKCPGKVVRYGYPRAEELLNHEYLTTYNIAIHNHPDLLDERTHLIEERKKLSKTSSRYVEIGKRLTKIRADLSFDEKEAAKSAAFVATTVSKAMSDKDIFDNNYDVVIFDEASMAYIPQIMFAASLATKNFICLGDFSQLPPIVQSNEKSILNADIFQYCGISDAVANGNNHKWLCMLNVQYRMHPDIASFASSSMYNDLLSSYDSLSIDRASIVESKPFQNFPIGLVDISGMLSVCTKTNDFSRINPLSAFITFGLALIAQSANEIGIITPYSAQSRLLHAMARDITTKCTDFNHITCATVHQFQGSEKDVIIYDSVDCYLQRYPGVLLTSTKNNYANRLFNVALTRARGKFIVVSNVDYMDNKRLTNGLIYKSFLSRYKGSEQCIDGKTINDEFDGLHLPCYKWLDRQSAQKKSLLDIERANKEIRIDIPDGLDCDRSYISKLNNALNKFKGRGGKVIIRAFDRKLLVKDLHQDIIENKFITNPITIIDNEIIWFNIPMSSANFISDGTQIITSYHPIIRFVGKYTASALLGFLEMNKTIDQSSENNSFASYVFNNIYCDSCGDSMKLRENDKGKYFLGCVNYPECKCTKMVTVDMIEKYFTINSKHCPQDKTSLEAKIGPYGIYVQCCGIAKHKFTLAQI